MFYLLYRVAQRGRNRRRNLLKPERISDASSTGPKSSAPAHETETTPPDIT